MLPGVHSTPKTDFAETGIVIFDSEWVEWKGEGLRRPLWHKVLNWTISTGLLFLLVVILSFLCVLLRLDILIPFFFAVGVAYAIIAWTVNLLRFSHQRGWKP